MEVVEGGFPHINSQGYIIDLFAKKICAHKWYRKSYLKRPKYNLEVFVMTPRQYTATEFSFSSVPADFYFSAFILCCLFLWEEMNILLPNCYAPF